MKNRVVKTLTLATLLMASSVVADNLNVVTGISGGYTYINVDQENQVGSFILANEPTQDGYNVELKLGYKYDNNFQLTMNYQRVEFDDMFENNVYVEVEYLYSAYKNFTPYIGGHFGISRLEWSENPINTLDNDVNSGSYIVGARAGTLYPLSENIALSMEYIFSLTDHDTQLESGSAKATLTHNFSHNLNFGLRYTF